MHSGLVQFYARMTDFTTKTSLPLSYILVVTRLKIQLLLLAGIQSRPELDTCRAITHGISKNLEASTVQTSIYWTFTVLSLMPSSALQQPRPLPVIGQTWRGLWWGTPAWDRSSAPWWQSSAHLGSATESRPQWQVLHNLLGLTGMWEPTVTHGIWTCCILLS